MCAVCVGVTVVNSRQQACCEQSHRYCKHTWNVLETVSRSVWAAHRALNCGVMGGCLHNGNPRINGLLSQQSLRLPVTVWVHHHQVFGTCWRCHLNHAPTLHSGESLARRLLSGTCVPVSREPLLPGSNQHPINVLVVHRTFHTAICLIELSKNKFHSQTSMSCFLLNQRKTSILKSKGNIKKLTQFLYISSRP